jgi:hypothetical protein
MTTISGATEDSMEAIRIDAGQLAVGGALDVERRVFHPSGG